jgi:hypothetical protein
MMMMMMMKKKKTRRKVSNFVFWHILCWFRLYISRTQQGFLEQFLTNMSLVSHYLHVCIPWTCTYWFQPHDILNMNITIIMHHIYHPHKYACLQYLCVHMIRFNALMCKTTFFNDTISASMRWSHTYTSFKPQDHNTIFLFIDFTPPIMQNTKNYRMNERNVSNRVILRVKNPNRIFYNT